MAALDFKNRSAVLAFLTDLFPSVEESVIEALLDASAGHDCDDPETPVYRPFYVQASLLSQRTNELQAARGASGASVTYRDNAKAIRSLYRQQEALDNAICGIPEGFEARGGGSVRVRTVF